MGRGLRRMSWDNEDALKCIFVGDGGSGKTCLLRAMLGLKYNNSYQPTIGGEEYIINSAPKNPGRVKSKSQVKTEYEAQSQEDDISSSSSESEVPVHFCDEEQEKIDGELKEKKSVKTDLSVHHSTLALEAKIREIKPALKDTSGQMEYLQNTLQYMEGADIIIICSDATNQDCVKNLIRWIKCVEEQNYRLGVSRQIFVVLTKIDAVDDTEHKNYKIRQSRLQELRDLTANHDVEKHEVSAATYQGVEKLVRDVTRKRVYGYDVVVKRRSPSRHCIIL